MIAVFDDKNGWRYISVLLGAANSETRVAEMQKMINFSGNYN
jgi:D-alanyl-D-alanine carboxypeptidase